ncbi:MAG: hypothetical protein Q9187_007415 [Circinaria calcarea]
MSGTSLGDRCSPFRGSTVPVSSVLNITDKQVVAGSRAAEIHKPQPPVQPLTTNGYGAPLGPNGRSQLVPAGTPAPLRGSFRGAISGQANGFRAGGIARGRDGLGPDDAHNAHQQSLPIRDQTTNSTRGRGSPQNGFHGRGRGNPTVQAPARNGYISVDLGNPDASIVMNNPNFRPQVYTNVPPPAGLDARGRGRGRGGSARGDGFRGRGFVKGRGAMTMQQP